MRFENSRGGRIRGFSGSHFPKWFVKFEGGGLSMRFENSRGGRIRRFSSDFIG